MRTTVELPPELMKEVKARAAAQGESLKSLLTRAVATELGKSMNQRDKRTHVRLPLFGNPRLKPVDVEPADIARAFARDDETVARRAMRRRKK
jgi:hypothetical protein